MSDGNGRVTITIDGKEITVPRGTLVVRAAEELGIEMPRFCDHPLLDPIGACRQCYVEVEGQRKLFTACTTEAVDGWALKTQNTSEAARAAQVANLEFLLINHPLDCPVCDRGGECPLQDQTLQFGPGESRFAEVKRTYEKPIALSALVALDRERCVLCARCTRFCDQISGDRFIGLHYRGARQQVAISAGEDFASPFSGNTIQICPVGALTARTYRFVARPFDLHSVRTVCAHCSAGCNMRADLRSGEVVRHLAACNLDVNDEWMCDKGRFAFRWVDSPDRLDKPMIREDDLKPASFPEIFARIAEWRTGGKVGFITGGRLTDEDYYALSKLARKAFRTNDIDHRRQFGGGEAERSAALGGGVTYRGVESAKVIAVVGLDAEQEVPILHLRIRKAARKNAKVFVVHPRRTRLDDLAEHLLCKPGEEARAMRAHAALASALRDAGRDAIVIAGPRLADGGADAVLALANETGARFAWVTRRANEHGALRAGVRPDLLPGGRRVSDTAERAEVEAIWGALPEEPGRNAREILEAAASGKIGLLYLVGVDPLRDFPDAALAKKALENVAHTVVQDTHSDVLENHADAMLPAATFVEKEGHFTDWEGRSQRVATTRGPAGVALPDWEIFAALARAMGEDLGFSSLEALREEMDRLLAAREAPSPAPLEPSAPAAPDGLALFSYPLLVDEGRLSEGASELKAALEQEAFVEINDEDAAALGLADGDRATVRTDAGEAILPVRVTSGIAKGAVFVPFNQPGLAANALLSGAFSASVTVERAGGDA